MSRNENDYARYLRLGVLTPAPKADISIYMGDETEKFHLPVLSEQAGENCKLRKCGEGSSSVCYWIEDGPYKGRIVKEFFPESIFPKSIKEKRLTRDNDGPLTALHFADKDKDELQLRYEKFLHSIDTIDTIGAKYGNDGTFLGGGSLYKTSIGYCYLIEPTASGSADKTVEEFVKTLNSKRKIATYRQFLADGLLLLKKILDDLTVYHKNTGEDSEYLNCDLKEANLLKIKIDVNEENYCVRNLDFGSCIKLGDLIADIKNYQGDDAEKFSRALYKNYFESTPGYYDESVITKAIMEMIGNDTDVETMKKIFKSYDVQAAFKIFAYLFMEPPKSKINYYTILKRILWNEWAKDCKSMEDYNIFYQICNLLYKVFYERMSAQEACDAIVKILHVMKIAVDKNEVIDLQYSENLENRGIAQFDFVLNEEILEKVKYSVKLLSPAELIETLFVDRQ